MHPRDDRSFVETNSRLWTPLNWGKYQPGLTPPEASPDYLLFTCSSIFDHARPRYAVYKKKSYIPFTQPRALAIPGDDGGSHSEWLHSNGRQPFSRERRQDTETKDWPPPKQTYPFEGTVLESSSLSHRPRATLRARWLSALGSHSNYVDFRRTSEREQTVHQIGKEQRVCSRDLTIPRRDAPAMSWISTSYGRTRAENADLIRFQSVPSNFRRKNLSLTRRFRSLSKPPPHAIVFRGIRYFYPLPESDYCLQQISESGS